MWKSLVLAAAVAVTATANAQDKKALVAKVLQLQQPGIESTARTVALQPAEAMLQQAGMVIQSQVPADKREALAQAVQADAKKYADDAVPIVRDAAVKAAPTTIGPLLEQNFSVDELKQLVSILESPVNRKFQQLGGDMQRALIEKTVADTRGSIEPKVRALEQSIGDRLRAAAGAPAAGAPSTGTAPR